MGAILQQHNLTPENIYIQKILLNGKTYSKTYITQNDNGNCGIIGFFMGKKPNKKMADYEKPLMIAE
jgi:putative alpha-1,2-mannosidase